MKVIFIVLFTKKSRKKNLFPQKTVFKIDNKKNVLSSISAYYYDFWRIMWHWRVMMLTIQLCTTERNHILKYIQIENLL